MEWFFMGLHKLYTLNILKMKKKIIIASILLILVLLFLYFRYVYGWYQLKSYNETPSEYVSNIVINKKEYSSDSASVVLQIHDFVKNHQESFYSKEYDESTRIVVDTILYSYDREKIAAFIIAKNPIHKLRVPDKRYKWYYNATCYLGIKNQDSYFLSWIGPNYSNSYDLGSISRKIRDYYFKQRSSNNNSNDEYNINDIRYWNNGEEWQKIEHKREMQNDSVGEKLKNPENVSEDK